MERDEGKGAVRVGDVNIKVDNVSSDETVV